jgi:hypothetical protein
MKANELRIGNLVEKSLKSGQGRKLIDKIGCQDIVRLFENTGSFNYEPIPLTEEWLLKFRFERSNRIDLGELKPCYAIFSLAVMIRHNSFFIDWIGGNTEIKHVHQLQNLYFALTGEELTISK